MPTRRKEDKNDRIVIRCEPSFVARANRVAEERYAGNRSYMVRLAISEFIDRKERESAIENMNRTVAA